MRLKQIAVTSATVLALALAGPVVDGWHHVDAEALGGRGPAAPSAAPVSASGATGGSGASVTAGSTAASEPSGASGATPGTVAKPTVDPSALADGSGSAAGLTPAAGSSPAAGATLSAGTSPGSADPRRPVVYLTFDDGPDPTWTPQVLALLAQYDAKATFFQIGEEAARFPGMTQVVLAAGHAVGSHTWDHPWLTHLAPAEIASQLTRTDAALHTTTACVRPPGGFVDSAVDAEIGRSGKRIALWDDDTRDWARPGVDAIVTSALATARRPGATILLHDGGGDRSQSVAALARILPALAAQGYRFESMPGC